MHELQRTANCAKTDDMSALRQQIIHYLMEDINDYPYPQIQPSNTKAGRGFLHPVTARHLCSVELLEDFDSDPEKFMDLVSEGKCDPTIGWPSFLYNLDIYDPDDVTDGFMCSFLLVRVYWHLFTGPSSAFTGHCGALKDGKAGIHNICNVTSRSIAYAAVQACFALSLCKKWCLDNGDYDVVDFFQSIVNVFERDPDDPWVIDTLEWWDNPDIKDINRHVPDLVPTRKQKRRDKKAGTIKNNAKQAANKMLKALKAKQSQKVSIIFSYEET
ncbi:hypothetical protein C0991_005319 [Blastosporella zonata]|nr:hypothetical protein C0991_005319 [Blastosporella zonata]